MHGIGSSEIRPTVSAGPAHHNSKSAAAECLLRDTMKTGADIPRNDIADRVHRRLETQLRQLVGKRVRTIGLLKRRSRNFAQADLIGFNVRFVFGNETKSPLDARIPNDRFDSRAHYLTSKVTGSDAIGGCVAILAVTL